LGEGESEREAADEEAMADKGSSQGVSSERFIMSLTVSNPIRLYFNELNYFFQSMEKSDILELRIK